jgi:colicin import membrane protein
MTENAPAGWYPQPDGTQRYWDGQQWTEHIAPGAGVSAPVSEPVAQTVAQPVVAAAGPAEVTPTAYEATPEVYGLAPAIDEARPWWKKKRFIIPGAALVLVVLVAAISSGGGKDDPATSPTPTAIAETSVSTPTPTADEEVPTTFTMPDVVGMNLQEAQDALQGVGSLLMDQTDASGQDRTQLDDSNWQVCTQDPAAGTEAPVETVVSLGSVKLDESCDGEAAVAEPDTSGLTAEQVEAVGSAESYLAFTAFSKLGLIDQLVFEEFSEKDAKAAVEALDVDWAAQAEAKAVEYLEFSAFSKSGLVDQLEFEQFTKKQAAAAVAALDVDWNEQAAQKAEEYLDSMNFSKKELIAQLKFEGFSTSQAEYGVKQAGL